MTIHQLIQLLQTYPPHFAVSLEIKDPKHRQVTALAPLDQCRPVPHEHLHLLGHGNIQNLPDPARP